MFYPADWSPVCGDQMALYNEMLRGVSAIRRGARRHLRGRSLVPPGVRRSSPAPLPVCSPTSSRRATWRSSTACTARQDGTSERALFVIDAGGVIRWSYVSPVGVNPGADGILRALESLPTREDAP